MVWGQLSASGESRMRITLNKCKGGLSIEDLTFHEALKNVYFPL